MFSVKSFFVNNIFEQPHFSEALAIQLFQHQYQLNELYRQWCDLIRVDPHLVANIIQIPFLPVSFFKTNLITTGSFTPELIFTSSGTTKTINSHHYVKDASLYKQSFVTAFEIFYGNIKDLCIIGLLPSYLERNNSSLIFMVNELILRSQHPQSGFYLYNVDDLHKTLQKLESAKQKTVMFGVTFALLDFAAAFPMPLHYTTIIETGGMKGRKEEMTREEIHGILQKAFGLPAVHSEYGMTELLSQAYSGGDGVYNCPPWMKVMVRQEDDPLLINESGKGILNIIDLANIDSCAFIATDDAGILNTDGGFTVLGRTDNSDLRGCSLLTL